MGLYFERYMMTETGIVFRPLYVAQARSRTVSLEKLLKKPHVITQARTIRNFAAHADAPLAKVVLVSRTQAKFDPATDNVFQKLLGVTKNGSEVILVDDFLRLIDCRNFNLAIAQVDYLKKNAPTLLSIAHGSTVKTISANAIAATIAARSEQSALRSESIKKGLKENAELFGSTKPTRKAIDKAAKSKSSAADRRARILFPEIERIRQSMPLEARDSHKALADALNAAGVETSTGRGQWQGSSVKRVLDRMDRINDIASK